MDKELLKTRFLEIKKYKEDPGSIPKPSIEPPSITQMAKNLGKSLALNAKSFVSGHGLTIPTEEANRRLEVCKGCEFFNSSQTRCQKCGCQMAVKTYLKAEKCPIGKW